MTEPHPILTDTAAERAFIVNMMVRLRDYELDHANALMRRAAGEQGLTRFLIRMRARQAVAGYAKACAMIERERLGL